MNLKPAFTSDEEMEYFEDQDMTTNIVGYVDTVTAPIIAGKNKDFLFKFVLSNGSKRIDILIWGQALINKFYKDVCSNRIMNINGGHCRAVVQSKSRKENNLIPFEILIRENTTVSFLGYNQLQEKNITLQKVNFDDIHTKDGLIEINGYIRTPFCQTHTRSGLTMYGIGAITNGSKKITVQVKQFAESKLELGDNVTIQGIVKGQDSLITIYCNSMDNIKLNSEVDQLSQEDIQRGGRAVKRIRTKEE